MLTSSSIFSQWYRHKHTHTHTHIQTHTTHTNTQSKSKVSSCHKGHAYLASQGTCALSRHMCRCDAISWSPGKELAGVLTVPPTAGVGTRSPTSTVSGQQGTASVLCSPVQDQVPVLQMGGLVGWRYYFDQQKFPSCPWDLNTHFLILWVMSTYIQTHTHIHTHIHTHTHTHTHARTHTSDIMHIHLYCTNVLTI